jgi:aspartyl-tRNA(Asn)/glutamyl-tRNA(Gln) amidotransferase subunit B
MTPARGTETSAWETVIGLEVHVQLATASKLFCRCEARFGAPPNTLVCEVCSAQPGVLPALNRRAVLLGVRAGLALGCTIDPTTKFDRKNYFYPDLPKSYQISQFDRPLCRDGSFRFDAPDGRGGSVERTVSIARAHLEEDSGKIIHPDGMHLSLVDLNRAGTPLMEIVSGPDLRSPEEAAAYLAALRRALRYAGVSECDMEQGSFRCDANVSLRPAGSQTLGTRTETKNLNSFRFVAQALAAEVIRQRALLEAGGRVVQQTMAFDPASGRTAPMRGKEQADDYRYFPEPDLPTYVVDEVLAPESVERLRAALPEAPRARRRRFEQTLGLTSRDAEALTDERELADYFEAVLAAGLGRLPAPAVASWMQTDLARLSNERKLPITELAVTPARLAELVALVTDGTLSVQAGRQVISAMEAGPARGAAEHARALDLVQVSDAGQLERLVAQVLADEAELVERFRSGKTGVFNALLGAAMKASGGKANPNAVRELLQRSLASD